MDYIHGNIISIFIIGALPTPLLNPAFIPLTLETVAFVIIKKKL